MFNLNPHKMEQRKFFDEKNVKPSFIILVSVHMSGYFTLSYFDVDFLVKLASSILFLALGIGVAYLWFLLVDKKK
jgi:4-amino-4-deoxy-L-arabinose transferase-like glycosyltransferase